MKLSDPGTARPYLTSEGSLDQAALSPDGRLVAYVASRDGTSQVYLQTFPAPGTPVPISSDRGLAPRWSPDGSRLYYWETSAADESATLFAATVQRTPALGVQSTLEVLREDDARSVPTWDLHPDGQRFAIARAAPAPDGEQAEGPARFRVVLNWFEEFQAALSRAGR